MPILEKEFPFELPQDKIAAFALTGQVIDTIMAECPRCKNQIPVFKNMDHYNYCVYCGQHLIMTEDYINALNNLTANGAETEEEDDWT